MSVYENIPLTDVNGDYYCDECGEPFKPPTDTSYRAFETVCPKCRGEEPEEDLRNESRVVLKAFVQLFLERKMREADISDGSRVPHGSSKHIKDLEVRIADLTKWRDKQRRGSEQRANYSRLVQRLKGELTSAKRVVDKKKKTSTK